jgi:putative ABC transport system permease protein
MMLADIFHYALCELRRRKARTLMCVTGYTLAVSSMIVLVGVLLAAKQGSAKILDHTGTHFVVFSPDVGLCGPCRIYAGNQVKSEGFVAFGTLVNLIPHEFVGKICNLSSVAAASPYLQYRFRDPNDGYLFTVGGFDLKDAVVVRTTCCAATDIVKGRFLAEGDRNKILVEQAYAQLRQINLGDTIRIAEKEFSVLGIIDPGVRPAKADIYMLYEDAERLIDPQLPNLPIQGNANLILVEVAQSSEQDRAIRAVKSLYPDLVISSYACYKPASRARRINTTSITLLIIVIGVLTVLLAIVSQLTSMVERRRELGILKTIGFSNSQIMSQVILESVLQAAIGSIAAVLIVILILPAALLKPLAAMNITLSNSLWLQISIAAVVLSLLGGLVAGIVPACWAGYKRVAVLLRCF